MTSISIKVVFSSQFLAIIQPKQLDFNMYFIFIFNDKKMAQIRKILKEKNYKFLDVYDRFPIGNHEYKIYEYIFNFYLWFVAKFG
jgi:hypothetical protein